MLYSVEFFALSGEEFAATLTKPPLEFRETLERYLQRGLKSDKRAIPLIVAAVDSLLNRKMPKNAPQEFFDAFYAILDVAAEKIAVRALQDFNYSAFLEETGIWEWFQQETPPFRMPKKNTPPPQFGYVSAGRLRDVVLPGLHRLPPCEEVRIARNQFAEVAESVAADSLDLLGYFTIW